jgi:hypothetical protein
VGVPRGGRDEALTRDSGVHVRPGPCGPGARHSRTYLHPCT